MTDRTDKPLFDDIERTLLDSSGDGILAFDNDLRYIYWNRRMEEISGKKAKEVLGKKAFDVFPFLTETGEEEYFHFALQGETSVSRNRRYAVPETRQYGWFEASYTPLHDKNGEIIGGMSVVRDITRIKEIEGRLEESENRFHRMADCAPVMVRTADTEGQCDYFNRKWLYFTGKPLDRELGDGWAEGVHEEDFQTCLNTYLEALHDQKDFRAKYRLLHRDGEYRWILEEGTPRSLPDGTYAGYIAAAIDIHEFQEAMASLATV